MSELSTPPPLPPLPPPPPPPNPEPAKFLGPASETEAYLHESLRPNTSVPRPISAKKPWISPSTLALISQFQDCTDLTIPELKSLRKRIKKSLSVSELKNLPPAIKKNNSLLSTYKKIFTVPPSINGVQPAPFVNPSLLAQLIFFVYMVSSLLRISVPLLSQNISLKKSGRLLILNLYS